MITKTSIQLFKNDISMLEVYRNGDIIIIKSPKNNGYLKSIEYTKLMESIEYSNIPFLQSILYNILWGGITIISITRIQLLREIFIPLSILSFIIFLYNLYYFKEYKNQGLLRLSSQEHINKSLLISYQDYKDIIKKLESLKNEIY